MMEIIASIAVIIGALFCLVAAVGVVRFPDLYYRMHASTKAAAFGVAWLLIAVNFALPGWRTAIESLLIVTFIYLTAPVAAQMIGRAGYRTGVKLWTQTRADQWHENEAASPPKETATQPRP